jgi:hypothetical protein
MSRSLRCVVGGVAALFLATTPAPGQEGAAPVRGFNGLFMGHSFFAPIAKGLPEHARRCGIAGHRQTVVFHGGANGSPGKLWESDAPDVAQARALIESGTVDLLGLTFYPDVGSDLADYRRWVDLARAHNPRTRFFIMAPWTIKQDRPFAAYEEATRRSHARIHGLLDELRRAYPGTAFFCIPEGLWMVELWRRFDRGDLPEVTALEPPEKERGATTLFADHFGHGGPLAVRNGVLLWLAAIYGVDLRSYDYDPGTKADLRALAAEIVERDPYAGGGRP